MKLNIYYKIKYNEIINMKYNVKYNIRYNICIRKKRATSNRVWSGMLQEFGFLKM
jgi:hypothetical protein